MPTEVSCVTAIPEAIAPSAEGEPAKQIPKVFLALPHYGGWIRIECGVGVFCHASRKGYASAGVGEVGTSLLAFTFNQLLANALTLRDQGKCTHFAMIHSDIAPQPWWLDMLVDELLDKDADMMSAVVPIKNMLGLTSTGIGHTTTENETGDVWKRFTMHEVMQFPETFCGADTGYPDHPFLVNTGCWVADITKPWAYNLQGAKQVLSMGFDIHSEIRKQADGKYFVAVEPEDWRLSRYLHSVGAKVYATRKVKLDHCGEFKYPNHAVWGAQATDRDTSTKWAGSQVPQEKRLALQQAIDNCQDAELLQELHDTLNTAVASMTVNVAGDPLLPVNGEAVGI